MPQKQVGLIVARRVADQRIAIDLAQEQPDGLLFVMPAESDVILL